MKKYRFKEVLTNGKHFFVEQEFPDRMAVFMGAHMIAQISEGVDHIDVYNESDKRIATFYK